MMEKKKSFFFNLLYEVSFVINVKRIPVLFRKRERKSDKRPLYLPALNSWVGFAPSRTLDFNLKGVLHLEKKIQLKNP